MERPAVAGSGQPAPSLGLARGSGRYHARTVGLAPLPSGTADRDDVQMACRILIVDDSEHFRRTAGELLAARGFEPLAAVGDGEAALVAISADCPDGVLLDINLPGRNGYAVATSIAATCPAVTIVLTSSDTENVPSAVLNACGATAFVPKIELAAADLEALFAG
jgi:CheY-like chemotaxis protein